MLERSGVDKKFNFVINIVTNQATYRKMQVYRVLTLTEQTVKLVVIVVFLIFSNFVVHIDKNGLFFQYFSKEKFHHWKFISTQNKLLISLAIR